MVLQHSSLLNIKQSMGDSVAQRTGRQPQAAVTSGYQVDWAGLAHNLSYPLRETFFSAVDTLLSFSPWPINEFKMNSRKVCNLYYLCGEGGVS
jgi:hypothetical protein